MKALLCALVLSCALVVSASAAAKGGKPTNFTVRDIYGKHLRLSDYQDKLVLMSFWATWCKPCLLELRHLQKLYAKYKDKGFVVLAVSMDGPESQAKVKPFVQRYRLTFPVAVDKDTRVVKLYNPKHAAPFSLLLGKGKVLSSREGFQVSDLPAIEEEIRKHLP